MTKQKCIRKLPTCTKDADVKWSYTIHTMARREYYYCFECSKEIASDLPSQEMEKYTVTFLPYELESSSKLCSCDILTIMRIGCKCGGA